jgi:hypothetical protein
VEQLSAMLAGFMSCCFPGTGPVKLSRPYLNHSQATMNSSVDSYGCFLTACLDKTEDLATAFIDPVCQVRDAVLELKIVPMCFCDSFESQLVHHVVDIHEEWHKPFLLRWWCSLCSTGGIEENDAYLGAHYIKASQTSSTRHGGCTARHGALRGH